MASKRIAGITIEIGGDTKKLQSALKGVDKQLSTTQSNLKDINKLLKVDPGNVDLLKQKYKNLQGAITQTKDRLKTLKDAQKQATTPEEYDALQREIIETEQNLKSLEDEYKNFGSVAKQKLIAVGNQLKETGERITQFGTKWTTHVTAPILGVGAAAYKAFTEVDEGLDTIITKTGATGKNLAELERSMNKIATDIPTDFKTAGEAVAEVNTRFGLTGKALDVLSTQYVQFAKINNTDVAGSVDRTQKALAAFGLNANSAQYYLDYLTYTAQKTGVSVDTLTTGAVQNAAAFKAMGFDIYRATDFMGQLEVSGADSSAVMGGLGKALKKSAKQGKTLDQSLGDIQDAILNGKDGVDGLTLAYEYFGNAGAQVYEAVKNGTLDFNDLAKSASNVRGTVSDTFEATLDPADEFMVAMNNLKLLGADIAKSVMPALSRAINKVKDVIVAIKKRWDGLTKSQQDTILKVAGIVAAIGPVIAIIGKVTSGIGSLIGLLTGPAGIAIAIGAVVAAAANWDTLKEKIGEIWETIKGVLESVWKKIQEIDWLAVGKRIWDGLVKMVSDIGTWLAARFKEAVTLIKAIDWKKVGADIWGWITSAFNKIGEWFQTAFKSAADWIKEVDWEQVGNDIMSFIITGIGSIVDWYTNLYNDIADAIENTNWEDVGQWIWDAIVSAFDSVVTFFKNLFGGGGEDSVTGAVEGIDWKGLGESIWRMIKGAFNAVVSILKKIFENAWIAIKNVDWAQLGKDIWNFIKAAFSAIGTWFADRFESAKTAIKNVDWAAVGKAIWDWIKQAFAKIGTWFSDRFESAKTAIKNVDWAAVGKAIWDWIKNAFTNIGTWFMNRFESAKTAIKNVDWAAVGKAIWDWIKGAFTSIGDWFNTKFEEAADFIKSIDWASVGKAIWDAIKGAITGVGTWFKNTFKKPINAVIDMLNGLIGTAEGVVNTVIKGINKALSISIPAKDFGILGRFNGWSWSPGLKTVSWDRIDHLYKGGVLREGEGATVGEYAPEYLTVKNGQAVVTPIPGAERWGGGETINNTFQIYQQPGENPNALAERVIRIMTRQQTQRNNAYA